ncbi:hypothetical protein D3C81_280300 [compost metagenome]
MPHCYPQALQQTPRADARTLQDTGRTHRACAEDNLATGTEVLPTALPTCPYRRGTTCIKGYLIDQNIGEHGQIGAIEDRAQKGLGRIPANAGALVNLKVSTALIIAAVEISNPGDTTLRSGITEGIENRPGVALLLNPPFTRTAVDITGTGKVVFAGFEQRQDIVPGPTGVALLGPPVVVTGLATHVDHAIDRGTATEHLAPWVT